MGSAQMVPTISLEAQKLSMKLACRTSLKWLHTEILCAILEAKFRHLLKNLYFSTFCLPFH